MADGLWQRVRLILDRQSAEEVKRESQDALTEGTDPKQAERNLDRVDSRMQRVRRSAIALGAAIVAAFTVRAIGSFLRDSFNAAETLRTGRVRLQQALRNEGIAWNEVEGELSAYTRQLWETHRLTEGEVNPTLQTLITTTGDYQMSLRGVGIAADLAAAANMDVQSAARLVGRVMNGETTALRRYGITIEEGADAVAVLEERLAGMAIAATPATEQLTKAWGDLKEAIGEVLIVGGETDSLIGRITDSVRNLTERINDNQDTLAAQVRAFTGFFGTLLRLVRGVARPIIRVIESIGSAFGALWQVVPVMARLAMAETQNAVLTSVRAILTPLRALGITIGEEFVDNAIAGVRSRHAALTREMEAVGSAFRSVLGDIWNPQERTGAAGEGDGGGFGAGTTPGIGGGGPGPGLSVPDPVLREIGINMADHIADGFAVMPERVGSVLEDTVSVFEEFDYRVYGIGRNLERGFMPFFDAMYQGFGDTAQLMDGFVDAAQGVGAAVIGALAEGQVEYHRAQGIAKLAEGTWPPNPAAIAASLQHFAASAAFAALPGIVGGQGGGRGGGAAGQLGGMRSPDFPRMGSPRGIGPDIIIRVDGVDPKSPRHQELVGKTAREYQQRYGGRIRVEG